LFFQILFLLALLRPSGVVFLRVLVLLWWWNLYPLKTKGPKAILSGESVSKDWLQPISLYNSIFCRACWWVAVRLPCGYPSTLVSELRFLLGLEPSPNTSLAQTQSPTKKKKKTKKKKQNFNNKHQKVPLWNSPFFFFLVWQKNNLRLGGFLNNPYREYALIKRWAIITSRKKHTLTDE